MNNIQVISDCRLDCVPEEILNSRKPLLLKGLVSDWPVVKSGDTSNTELSAYLEKFYCGRPVTYYRAEPSENGKIFYNTSFDGFNFKRSEADLRHVLKLLSEVSADHDSPMYYVGSTLVDSWLPGFRGENPLTLMGVSEPLVSVWLGNKSVVSAHYDCPNNIACNVAGRRTFTLFPPEQLENLYVGPLDITPSGRPISMVDIDNPDLTRFPKYEKALKKKIVVDLEPGDAILIPGMWWHHVKSQENLNVLVNYWWRNYPDYMGNPEYVLHHALMSLRGLPDDQRKVWKRMFDHYIFDYKEENHRHIPSNILGILGARNRHIAKKIKAHLASIFGR